MRKVLVLGLLVAAAASSAANASPGSAQQPAGESTPNATALARVTPSTGGATLIDVERSRVAVGTAPLTVAAYQADEDENQGVEAEPVPIAITIAGPIIIGAATIWLANQGHRRRIG